MRKTLLVVVFLSTLLCAGCYAASSIPEATSAPTPYISEAEREYVKRRAREGLETLWPCGGFLNPCKKPTAGPTAIPTPIPTAAPFPPPRLSSEVVVSLVLERLPLRARVVYGRSFKAEYLGGGVWSISKDSSLALWTVYESNMRALPVNNEARSFELLTTQMFK